jgi:surface antigen
MSSFDDRSDRPSDPTSFQRPGYAISPLEMSPIEIHSTESLPVQTGSFADQPATSTRQLTLAHSLTTRQLPTVDLAGNIETGPLRNPVVIKGEMKKQASTPYVFHKKRRTVVSLVAIFLLFAITIATLFEVSPLGREAALGFNPLQLASGNLVKGSSNGLNSLVAQATATATFNQVTDGYVPPSTSVPSVANGLQSLDWPVGQCTYWANLRYHELTGFWVPWGGNADEWVVGAENAGWNVSTAPPANVASIIVLMPGEQGASSFGHVAVVESIVPNSSPTTVVTSNMNWFAGNGGFDIVSDVDFTVDPGGVYFIWHP